MNVLNMFEDRIGTIFGASSQGYTAPFSFKRLAKKAAHEMENETYVISGVDTAPALYTILVSADDDAAMRPLYAQLTSETSSFIQAQAEKRGYVFVGEPLVRFMPDPSLKSGKFSVFAENVDARTLNRLRSEEDAFLGNGQPAGRQRRRPAAEPVQAPQPVRTERRLSDSEVGLERIPADMGANLYQEPIVPVAPAVGVAPVTPVVQPQLRSTPLVDPRRADAFAPAQDDVAETQYVGAAQPAYVEPAPIQHQQATDSCLLIDRQSGRTYTATAPRTILGRERTAHGIVLHDPNVSRRHAELSFDGRDWRITDLNSTNGTLVNDVDIDECLLRNGDLITVGLVNLEFREG